MRNLLMVCAGLVVLLGIVSGNLWRELRAERQKVANMQAQMGPSITSDPGSVQVLPQFTSESKTAPVVAVQVPETRVVTPAPQAAPMPSAAAASQLTAAVLDAVHAEAMAQSERTATARTMAWRDRLTIAGQTLTTPQLQALNTAAIAELKREAQETFEMESAMTGPVDAATIMRLRDETIDRQNETNLRILKAVGSQLTPEQISALRTVFEAGDASRRASARADRERAAAQ